MNVAQIEGLQELIQIFIFLCELDEKFLSMAAGLGARARANVLLDKLPLLSIQLESLEEAEVLVPRPPAGFGIPFLLGGFGHLLTISFGICAF